MTDTNKIFARKDEDGNYQMIVDDGDGTAHVLTRQPDYWPTVYPEGSTLSGHHEHPYGIVLNPVEFGCVNLAKEIKVDDGLVVSTVYFTRK